MRIVGGHDYYDSALAYGRDDDITFVRKLQCFPADKPGRSKNEVPKAPLEINSVGDIFWGASRRYGGEWGQSTVNVKLPNQRSTTEFSYSFVTVFFCGKRYSGIKLFSGAAYPSLQGRVETFWSGDTFKQWCDAHEIRLTNRFIDEYSFAPRDATPNESSWLVDNKIAIALYSTDISANADCLEGWQNPNSFVDRYGYQSQGYPPWRCNAANPGNTLKEYGFMKVMDNFTAMQELSMYIGGVLPGDSKPMVKITDEKTLVAKHGFDKWSFRKMPGT